MPAPNASIVVLVHPSFALSTAAVFAELRAGDLAEESGGNDLLAPALRLRPELSDLMQDVVEAGGVPRLTGSGSTIFARTDDSERAAAIVAGLRRRGLAVTETRLRRAAAQIVELDDPPNDGGAPPPSMG
jgi:4-diphosphocytidyl-2C-methyl-D-erythritol kinase